MWLVKRFVCVVLSVFAEHWFKACGVSAIKVSKLYTAGVNFGVGEELLSSYSINNRHA